MIDFELEGFEEHVGLNHNAMNYVFYLFYLRKQNPKYYGIVEKFVQECQLKKKKLWIPNETSMLREEKLKLKEKENEHDQDMVVKEYIDRKIKDIKQIRIKNAQIVSELRLDNSKHKP